MRSIVKKKKNRISDKKNTSEDICDIALLEKIQPKGGIKFTDEENVRTGSGYECCIHIYEYPQKISDFWLANLTNIANTVATVDVSPEDILEVKKNINKSMKEQGQRYKSAENYSDESDAQQRYREMKELFDEINGLNEVVKLVDIRIFVAERTWVELEDRVKKIMDTLETNGYRPTIYLNENKNEWVSVYWPYAKQQENTFAVPGQPLTAQSVGFGNPFHFSYLEDKYGSFFGETPCGGNFIFDLYAKTPTRLYYNALVVGTMGSGKSTILKKIFADRAARGDFIRTFDIVGDYTELTKMFGGKIIKCDGSNGIINMLEILHAGDNEQVNYARHISKVITIYKYLVPEVSQEEINDFTSLLGELYESFGLQTVIDGVEQQITGLPPNRYPILSDLLDFINEKMSVSKKDAASMNPIEMKLAEHNILILQRIKKAIRNVVYTFGTIFNGHTSIDKLVDEQIVTFDISTIKNMAPEVFDAQLFNMLSLCNDNCVTNGSIMKAKYESGQIAWEDIIHFLIIADESHRWINTQKLQALDLIAIYLREMRKLFGGMVMASQSLRDYVPEGSSDVAINKIKIIFELTQYKFIFHQDANTLGLIDTVFDHVLTQSQIEKIPKLEMGETILSISSDKNLQFKVLLTDEEKQVFSGGA